LVERTIGNEKKKAAKYLREEMTLLDDISNSLLSYTSSFVDVLESVKFTRALVLDDPHLEKDDERLLDTGCSKLRASVITTLPNAPLPTARWRSKW
jgi:hypothetical protein